VACAAGGPGLVYAGFGQFHGHAQLDLTEDLVELFVAGAVLKVGGDRFEPQERGRLERAGQEAEPDLVQCIEGAAAMFDRPAAALDRILDALQGDQGVDPADGPQATGGLAVCGVLASDNVKGPPLARRAIAGAEARAVPFGPLTRMPVSVAPYG
jgi:hypothetical protein